VLNALEAVGADAQVIEDPAAMEGAAGVILPGVGAFRDGMANLERAGFPDAIRAYVDTGRPLLGICLGMQMLAERSEEYGDYTGLGLIPGTVTRIESLPGLRIPHVGWNTLDVRSDSVLFDGLSEERSFYFVHSYHLEAAASDFVTATTDYGVPLTACVQRDNVHGVQFHPEKSQRDGLKLLTNFVALCEG
jgi:glutamine amidotransferase